MGTWINVRSGVRMSVADSADEIYANDTSWKSAKDGGAAKKSDAPAKADEATEADQEDSGERKPLEDMKMTELRSEMAKAGNPMTEVLKLHKAELIEELRKIRGE